jgi:c-di-GMP-binding flagellar brake protein YcgR
LESELVRPVEGEPVTVLVEVNGIPLTHAARAGRVQPGALFVPRTADDRWDAQTDAEATVLFTHRGRLYSWPMRVEAVLPASYYLIATQDPAAGERRQFVRAPVRVHISLARAGKTRGPWREVLADVSAAGLRMECDADVNEGETVELVLRSEGHGDDLRAQARVVRRFSDDGHAEGKVPELALEFVQLGSADEERLEQIVFRARESELHDRIGRR